MLSADGISPPNASHLQRDDVVWLTPHIALYRESAKAFEYLVQKPRKRAGISGVREEGLSAGKIFGEAFSTLSLSDN
jgi:hypothetical protein